MQNGEKNTSNQETDSSWGSLSDFAGEQNLNSGTGKARTFSEFDLYPKMPGESNEEYGERLKFMHEKTAEYEAAETAKAEEVAKDTEKDAYFASEQGQNELGEEAKFDRLVEKLEHAVAEGKMSAEHAKNLMERQLEQSVKEIEGYRQDYEDRQSVGSPDEEARYEEWFRSRDLLDSKQSVQPELEQEPSSESPESPEFPESPEAPKVSTEILEEKSKEELIKGLLPEVKADVEDKLADIEKWRERDANRPWLEGISHGQDFYDKMSLDVIEEAIAINQTLLESRKESESTPVQQESLDGVSSSESSESSEEAERAHQEEEERLRQEEAERARQEENYSASTEKALTKAKEVVSSCDEKIAKIRAELDEIEKVKSTGKPPRLSFLSYIFGKVNDRSTKKSSRS